MAVVKLCAVGDVITCKEGNCSGKLCTAGDVITCKEGNGSGKAMCSR